MDVKQFRQNLAKSRLVAQRYKIASIALTDDDFVLLITSIKTTRTPIDAISMCAKHGLQLQYELVTGIKKLLSAESIKPKSNGIDAESFTLVNCTGIDTYAGLPDELI